MAEADFESSNFLIKIVFTFSLLSINLNFLFFEILNVAGYSCQQDLS